jgi:carboxymethylenebutenolidase
MAKKWAQQMKELGKSVEIHIYPGAGHGFANETGKNYNKEATADAWTKTRDFLSKHLKK